MKATVTKLCDLESLTVPEEMTKWRVRREDVEEQLNSLALSHAVEHHPDSVASGDSVRLSTDGRMDVLLYPGLNLPGAQEAEKAVLGLGVGDAFTAPIGGFARTMRVEEIRRRAPAAIDDTLVQAENIDGVSTVEQYRAWYCVKTEAQNKETIQKEIAMHLLGELRERSEYAFDREEVDAWAGERAQGAIDDCIAMGEDPHIPDEGVELLTDEQVLEKFKDMAITELKTRLAAEALCRQENISISFEDSREEFEQMLPPDLEISEEDREASKAAFVEGIPVTKAFNLFRARAEKLLED